MSENHQDLDRLVLPRRTRVGGHQSNSWGRLPPLQPHSTKGKIGFPLVFTKLLLSCGVSVQIAGWASRREACPAKLGSPGLQIWQGKFTEETICHVASHPLQKQRSIVQPSASSYHVNTNSNDGPQHAGRPWSSSQGNLS